MKKITGVWRDSAVGIWFLFLCGRFWVEKKKQVPHFADSVRDDGLKLIIG
jgi:hypothetical protein